MTDLDALLSQSPARPESARSVVPSRGGRPRHRHRWVAFVAVPTDPPFERQQVRHCDSCGVMQDVERSRRGFTSRNYGNRAELDVARRYGGRKVGHAGGPVDVVGKSRVVQLKTSRRTVPPMWRKAFMGLEQNAHGRLPVLLLRYVRAGNLGPDDYFVVKAADFLAWYGPDGEET